MKWIFFLLVGILLVSGCTQASNPIGPTSNTELIKGQCMALCGETLSEGADISDGPCLSDNNPEWTIDDWVCDVAHSPREDADDLPENQCSEFREGIAKHFVEIDTDCELIRAV